MKTIWKYIIQAPVETFEMPRGAVVLAAHEQYNQICIWAEVFPDLPRKSRTFVLAETGHPMPEGDLGFIGTVLIDEGHHVFQVYERMEG